MQGKRLIIIKSFQKKMFLGMCCHTDHALLESFSRYGFTKFLN